MARDLAQAVMEEVNPIVTAMGFKLVELRLGRSKGQSHVAIVVFRPEGVGINDCAAISRNLLPRLELIDWLEDLRLQVSSPGLDRVIRQPEEYEIFRGKGLRVLAGETQEWIGGINEGIQDGSLILNQHGTRKSIRLEEIRKAKLDYLEEAREV